MIRFNKIVNKISSKENYSLLLTLFFVLSIGFKGVFFNHDLSNHHYKVVKNNVKLSKTFSNDKTIESDQETEESSVDDVKFNKFLNIDKISLLFCFIQYKEANLFVPFSNYLSTKYPLYILYCSLKLPFSS